MSTYPNAWSRERGITCEQLAARHPHGTRQRYESGCKCVACRAAKSRYVIECNARAKRGEGNPIVSAAAARAHILALYKLGVGKKAVAAAASVALSVVSEIRSGRARTCRRKTERAILSIDAGARSDGALVDAAPTWKLIRALKREGFTLYRIAQEIFNDPSRDHLQIHKHRIRASTATRVERLYRRYMEE